MMDLVATATTQTTTGALEARQMSVVLFYLFAILTGGSAIGVAVSRNIVRTAVFLLFALVGVAGLFFLLESEFLAAAQLVIYVGGTLILIIFGVMLTSKSPFAHFEPKMNEVIIAATASLLLLGGLVVAIGGAFGGPKTTAGLMTAGESGRYPVVALGQALLGDFLVPFELASVLLLVVMIGAAYLAKGRRREDQSTVRSDGTRSAERAKKRGE